MSKKQASTSDRKLVGSLDRNASGEPNPARIHGPSLGLSTWVGPCQARWVPDYRLWHGSPVAASYGRGRVAASIKLIAICDGYRAIDCGAKWRHSAPYRRGGRESLMRASKLPGSRVLKAPLETRIRLRPAARGRSAGASSSVAYTLTGHYFLPAGE
jgi:hypothetical protein